MHCKQLSRTSSIGRLMETIKLEVGTGLEFYVSCATIVIRRQRPKPFDRPPMPLETKLWRDCNHSIITWQILGVLGKREELLILLGCPGSTLHCGKGLLIYLVFCFVFFVLFVIVLWLVWQALPMSLNCTLLLAHSVFSNVYISYQSILINRWWFFWAEYNMLPTT